MSEPHTSELAGGFSICTYGTYEIPYISMIYLSGALPQVWARDQLAWVRGQEHISCCTWRINELNCKIMDREDRLRNTRELDALQKQQNRKNFACQGAGKLTGLGVLLCNSQCCSASLAHARPTMFYIPPSRNTTESVCPTDNTGNPLPEKIHNSSTTYTKILHHKIIASKCNYIRLCSVTCSVPY